MTGRLIVIGLIVFGLSVAPRNSCKSGPEVCKAYRETRHLQRHSSMSGFLPREAEWRNPTYGKSPALPSVVINEIMVNEPGSATTLEWVEIYNRSDASVNVGNHYFIDGSDTTILEAQNLAPDQFAVLARDMIAFESTWGDTTGVWGDNQREGFLLIEASMHLRNSGDTIAVYGPADEFTEVSWERSPRDGISLERVRYDVPDDQAEFKESIDPSGSTPGRINSQTPRRNDLSFDSAATHFPSPGSLAVVVENVGLGESVENIVSVYSDLDENQSGERDELFTELPVLALAEGMRETLTIDLTGIMADQVVIVLLHLGVDGNPLNNVLTVPYRSPGTRPEVVINEFMPDPHPDGSHEWVEILVTAEDSANLAGWSIGDSVQQSIISQDDVIAMSGEYLVLCQDSSACVEFYPDLTGREVVKISPWRSLNNGGDKIILRDAWGFVVDSLTYTETFDGDRSVERISSTVAAADPDNWMGSVDPAGATPGRENSVSVTFADEIDIAFSPNPFRAGEHVTISYQVPRETVLSIRVFGRNGRPAATILDSRPVVSGSIEWDGCDGSGAQLPPGLYVMLIEANDGSVKKLAVAIAP